MIRTLLALFVVAPLAGATIAQQPEASRADDTYLSWSADQAQSLGALAYKRGSVGSFFTARLLKTERAINYKLAATVLTPQTIRATARQLQLRSRLAPAQTVALVTEAEQIGGLAVMIEIDPREGSGVLPLDWEAFLQPEDQPDAAVAGVNTPALRDVKALAGVLRRNYDYERFWFVFPTDAAASFAATGRNLQLIVRIYDKEGRVEWPASLLREDQ